MEILNWTVTDIQRKEFAMGSSFILVETIGLLLRATTFSIDVYALSSLGLFVIGAAILRGSLTLSP